MNKKLIAGNWKMNGSLAANDALVRALVRALVAGLGAQPACDVAVAVPAPYLAQLQALVAGNAVLLKPGAGKPAAAALLQWLRSEPAQAVIRTYGYERG